MKKFFAFLLPTLTSSILLHKPFKMSYSSKNTIEETFPSHLITAIEQSTSNYMGNVTPFDDSLQVDQADLTAEEQEDLAYAEQLRRNVEESLKRKGFALFFQTLTL